MRKLILSFLVLSMSLGLFAQDAPDTKAIIKEFEKYCPSYILDNYCSRTGLTEIIQSAMSDERVGGIDTKNQNRQKDPEVAILYLGNVIVFEKYHNAEYLGVFNLYFQNEKDLEAFSLYYAYLMGFIRDKENNNRFYYENGPMNALTKIIDSTRNFYLATCFVYQPDFCGK